MVASLIMDLNLDGDFRKTKKKITWLAQQTADLQLASISLVDFDYLITKKKLEENDDVKDFVTPITEFKESAYADANVLELDKGDIIQFERKGYYIYDGDKDGVREFFKIPDGKAAGIASKAGAVVIKAASSAEKTVIKPEEIPPVTSMYRVERVCEGDVKAGLATNMYEVENIYKT